MGVEFSPVLGLYCVIPVSWFDEGADVQAALRERTLNFFNRSKRINFVNYVWHGMHKQGDGVVMPTVSFPVINDNARMPAPDLGLLTWSHPAAEDFKSAVAAGRVFAAQPGDDMRYMQFVRSSA